MDQLRALVALRWQMIRDPRVQRGLLLLALSLPLLILAGGTAGQFVRDGDLSANLLLLNPSLLLGFAVLTVVAPLSNGGGSELFPPEQLAAFPVTPRTVFLGSLASAPLNLAWATQVISLVATTAFVADRSPLVLLSVLTTFAYIAFTTTAGQAIGWYVVGVRQVAVGRFVTRAIGLAVFVGLGVLLALGKGTELLDASPTTRVTVAAQQGSRADYLPWALTTAVLAIGSVVAVALGARAADWALRRPSDDSRASDSRRMRRRGDAGSALQALLRADRGSVWRSTPLRRGLVVLALLPGAVAAGAGIRWSSLALIPGLVAAGSGLLFGVNAFCLDGSGGLWLASLPHPGRTSALAKALVTGETCLLAVLVAAGTGSLRSPGPPTAADLTALVSSALASTALVAAMCLRLSVLRPHKADLRGPRDAPAPPATMTVYSLRLALATTLVGTLFVACAESRVAAAGPVLGLLVLAWAARSLRRTLRTFDTPAVRARVVSVVAAG
jgi:hypothetical protein